MEKNRWIIVGIIIIGLIGFLVWRNMAGSETTTDETSPSPTNSMMLDGEGEYNVETSDVSYFEETTGFYAKPTQDGQYPGVVMIHEWWGLNDNIKDMARQLASKGYRVLAVDLYNGQTATDANEARRLTSSLDQEVALENLKSAVDYLQTEGSEKVASLGWCFGGGQSLQLSLSEVDLDATVIYYGNLVNDEGLLANIKWPVLGIFGDQDQSIPVSDVNEFEEALNSVGVENEIYIYPGVGHAFANPSGANYAPDETQDAWVKTTAFLDNNLK